MWLPSSLTFQIAHALPRNDTLLRTNAASYPNAAALNPAAIVPIVNVVHCVVCVSELAVCSSSALAMEGRMAERPLVKNGDANISSALRV